MDDLVKEFIEETVDSLSIIDTDLVELEINPDNQNLLDKVFRLMHTIKGTCGFIGLSRLEKTAHATENLLDHFRSGTIKVNEKSITLLFMGIDRVRFLVSEVEKKGNEPDGNDCDIIDAIEEDIKSNLNSTEKPQKQDTPPVDQEYKKTKLPSSKAENTSSGEKSPEFLRVQMSVLEDLINMVSELVLTRNQLLQLSRINENSPMNTPLQRLNRIVSDLQDNVMKTRMQPIGNAWSKLPRIVRDLSSELNKKIVLEMSGEETELDRQVLEMIKDPLTHMVRNSCDHGIETPETRRDNAKKETGKITLRAYHEGGFIIIQINDDGKGLDPDKIARKAIENGIIDQAELEKMGPKQILNLIMRPGFSTAEEVTNVSGRGVGMDVVRSNIEKIGGSIDMDSVLGQGTSFTIQIPLTLAIISALIVEIDGNRYAVPQMNIQELVNLNDSKKDMIEYIDSKPVLRLRNHIIPLLDSAVLFDKDPDDNITDNDQKYVAIMSAGSIHYGIIIDKIFDVEEVVIKSVSSVLRNANIFSGNTILGDGQVIMIFDPVATARKFNVEKEIDNRHFEHGIDKTKKLNSESIQMLMFQAGEGATKAIPLPMVSRIQVYNAQNTTFSEHKAVVQHDDHKLIPLVFADPNTQTKPKGDYATVILADDRSEESIGIIIDEIVDIADGVLNLNASTQRPGVMGSMILNKKTVDVLDVTYYLQSFEGNWFSKQSHSHAPYVPHHLDHVKSKIIHSENDNTDAQHPQSYSGPTNTAGTKKTCILVVDDSAFFRNMLHPILISAGYEVTLSEDALNAIQLHDQGKMYDVILSDIEMPNMDGYEFVEKMRQESSWKNTPFIAITSHNTPDDVEYGYKKGFNKYIGKFDKTELLQSIAELQKAS